jgi:peroxin-19
VLLPSLKEIVSKYPGWLEENGSKISPEEKERYESQLKLMQEVCSELEQEKAEDSPEVKKDRFTVVLDKMQRMQDLGQPPEDLVGPGENVMPNLGEGALPGGDQCSIM